MYHPLPFFSKSGEKLCFRHAHVCQERYYRDALILILLSEEVMVYSTAEWTSSEFLSLKYHDLTPSNLLQIRYDLSPLNTLSLFFLKDHSLIRSLSMVHFRPILKLAEKQTFNDFLVFEKTLDHLSSGKLLWCWTMAVRITHLVSPWEIESFGGRFAEQGVGEKTGNCLRH